MELRKAAIAALEALERYQVKRQDFERFADEIASLRAALAQGQGEPVAWSPNIEGHWFAGKPSKGILAYWSSKGVSIKLAYEAPPTQPQREPLTDEQIADVFDAVQSAKSTPWYVRYARAVERAHGIGDKS